VELRGVQALITGGSSGIGRAVALALADAGAEAVAVDYHQREDDARATCEEIEARGARGISIRADVGVARDVERMVAEAVERLGGLGVLINDAGYTEMIPFSDLDAIGEEVWDRVMAVNVKGLWLCCKAVVPAMKQQGYGKIINISSDTIWMGVPLFLHYVASKGAVFAFTRALARELAGTGIAVNAVTPGYTLTEAAQGIADPETVMRLRAWVVDQQIVKRAEEPADVTGTVVFLASADSDFITGQTINVNGGATHH
jgi:NAD(P)-dependent dehydrogenase (short-subunit alcohol dehydrogenase family)